MKTLATIGSFIKDHLLMVIGASVLFGLFFYVGHFQEFFYAGIRLIAVVFIAAVVLRWQFPQTLHKYINDSQLVTDFLSLDAKHKVCITMGMFAILFIVAAICFVHP